MTAQAGRRDEKPDRAERLGSAAVGRLLWEFSAPAIVGTMVVGLYNITDRIFVGNGVGTVGIGATTVSFPIMLISAAFGMMIGHGGNSLVSIRLGEQRRDDAERILGNAFTLLIGESLLLAAVGLIFLDPLLRLFGATEAILPHARAYMRIILPGGIFTALSYGMNNFIRGEGNPRIAMLTMVIGAVLNLILDPILIFGLRLGMSGAAIATVVAQAVSAAWVMRYYFGGTSLLKIRRRNTRPVRRIVLRILALGSPPFAMQVAGSGLFAVLNNQVRVHGGDTAISVVGVIVSVSFIVFMPIMGISQGSQPILGFNYGAQNFQRVRRTLMLAVAAATAVSTAGFLLIQAFPEQIFRAFNARDASLIVLGSGAIRTYTALMPVIGFQIVSANYFQAVGKPRQSLLLSLSRQVLLLIPLLILLPRWFGLDGVWMAPPASNGGSALLTAGFLVWELAHLGRGAQNAQG